MRYPNLAPMLLNLQVLILDVDGVLTGGGIIYGSHSDESKRFDVKDGLGLVLLHSIGIRTAIMTGRRSMVVERRAKELGIEFVLQGYPIKLPIYQSLREELELPDKAFGFIGDDLIDLDVMRKVGFSAAPADAHPAVKSEADYVCRSKSGAGAIREVVDLIIAFQRGEFAQQNYIPMELLEKWQDIVWENLIGSSPAKKEN